MERGHTRKEPSSQRRVPSEGEARPEQESVPPDRVEMLEAAVGAIQRSLDVQFKRIADMQVEIDRLSAKARGDRDALSEQGSLNTKNSAA